jgi:hypothetical protein
MKLDNCAICLEDNLNINNKKTLRCEHTFHTICINQYFGTNCPICKTDFIQSNIYYINKNQNTNFSNIILFKNTLFRTINRFFTLENTVIFLNLLNSKILLSGQLLLSIIQNSNEDINSLDLYIENYFNYKIICEFLKKNEYINLNEPASVDYLSRFYSFVDEPIIYKIKKYSKNLSNSNNINSNTGLNYIEQYKNNLINNPTINIIFNINNLYTIENKFKLDILKNYFDGNYFYAYNTTKIELKIDNTIKDKLDDKLKNIIQYYRSNNYNIFITEH